MIRAPFLLIFAACCLMAAMPAHAQAAPAQNPPANATQKPSTPPAKPADANPFPEDTGNVPVMPSKDSPVLPEGTYSGDDTPRLAMPGQDNDPVRSPDDAAPDTGAPIELTSSDSRSGLDKVVPSPDDDDQPSGKHKKSKAEAPQHQETPAEDIEVGKYYLEIKNWKGALSRFESALVMEPDEPDVYWGLAESERHLGELAAARGYYQKVAEYDPGSKHGKEAIKALKEPEIANAKAAPPAQPQK